MTDVKEAGRRGGEAYKRNTTPEQRSENARKAALAMHKKKREAKAAKTKS